MIETICPICKKETQYRFIEEINNYKMFLCSKCGVIFADPMKYQGCTDPNIIFNYTLRPYLKHSLNWEQKEFFKDFCPGNGKSLLDLGCGDGFFLKEAEKRGFKIYGIDSDYGGTERAKNEFKLENVHCDTIENFLNHTNQEWDYITLFHVIEHLEDPITVLNMVKNKLKKDGIICVTIPNRERFVKNAWKEVDSPPHHFTRYDVKSIFIVLSLTGFVIYKTKIGRIYFGDLTLSKIRARLMKKTMEKLTVAFKTKKRKYIFLVKCLCYIGMFIAQFINTVFDPLLHLGGVKGSSIYIVGINK